MRPVPPTGRSIRLLPESAWVRIRDGKLFMYHVEEVAGGGITGFLDQRELGSG
jgi:hypothetical protein